MGSVKKLGFTKKKKRKLRAAILRLAVLLLAVCGLSLYAIFKINQWFHAHEIVFSRPLEVKVVAPIQIVERKPEIREIVYNFEAIPEPEDLETEPEKLIYEYFGREHYRMAVAVANCEGLNHPPDDFSINANGTIDVGYMRINSANFGLEGCSLLEVATPEGNISCAYKIWDRADGEEGNGRGSFKPWVGYTNGCAVTKYE